MLSKSSYCLLADLLAWFFDWLVDLWWVGRVSKVRVSFFVFFFFFNEIAGATQIAFNDSLTTIKHV